MYQLIKVWTIMETSSRHNKGEGNLDWFRKLLILKLHNLSRYQYTNRHKLVMTIELKFFNDLGADSGYRRECENIVLIGNLIG